MTYRSELSSQAEKQLDKISDSDANRIIDAILKLENDPRPRGAKKDEVEGRSLPDSSR